MRKKEFVVNDEFRMKVVNFLKIYGYYGGVLVSNDMEKKYVHGEVSINDIIVNRMDFKELKFGINKVLEYCYENHFGEIEDVMNYFYRVECENIRKNYGSFFDRY